MHVILDKDLATYLGVEVTPSLTFITHLTNDLVCEAWANPVPNPPASITSLAINVASRAFSNPKGLSSWTVSWDDITRTERTEGISREDAGVYLTDRERALLAGTPARSTARTISTPVKGWPCF